MTPFTPRVFLQLYAALIAAIGVSLCLGGTLYLMSTPATLEVPALVATQAQPANAS